SLLNNDDTNVVIRGAYGYLFPTNMRFLGVSDVFFGVNFIHTTEIELY
ncbi:MAG: hypothetical protein ACI9K1_000639, partial [Arcticibacterium sp.]